MYDVILGKLDVMVVAWQDHRNFDIFVKNNMLLIYHHLSFFSFLHFFFFFLKLINMHK